MTALLLFSLKLIAEVFKLEISDVNLAHMEQALGSGKHR